MERHWLVAGSGASCRAAYLGIVTGVVGIFSEALRPVIGFAYIVFFVLEVIWLVAVGWRHSSTPDTRP